MPLAGIILAGGEGSRIGGAKPLRDLGGKPLLAHVAGRAAPQVDVLWLSTSAHTPDLGRFGLPTVDDGSVDIASLRGFTGPLAGIVAGLLEARRAGFARLAVFPCDVPFFPRDLVARLGERLDRAPEAVACHPAVDGETVPVFGLWKVQEALAGLAAMPVRTNRLKSVCLALHCARLDWASPASPTALWLNINTPADLLRAEAELRDSGEVVAP